jgi:prepilin-type N-terminal cleavage/methylation domain-containing protein
MKTRAATSQTRPTAFTLVELLVVVAILGILASLAATAIARGATRAKRIQCASNLRQIGLGLHSFAMDHRDAYPWQTAADEGGTKDADFYSDHWLVLSNELRSSRVFACPSDPTRTMATGVPDWDLLSPSYNLGKDASPLDPTSILATDRNLNDSIYELAAVPEAHWDREVAVMHTPDGGNGLTGDGGVRFWNDTKLRGAIATVLTAGNTKTVEFLYPPVAIGVFQ